MCVVKKYLLSNNTRVVFESKEITGGLLGGSASGSGVINRPPIFSFVLGGEEEAKGR